MAMSLADMRQPNFVLLLTIAWLLVVLQLVLQYWPETAETLLDTDDAMRLAQMRGLLAGQGWFDLHQPRLQPPLGYDSHWSRLIDAGLAGVYLLFRPFAEPALAERLMRTVWPLLWLIPAIAGAAALAWRIAGRDAALVVLLFAVIGLPALQQFKPGRIDHHNVQIAIVVLTVAATAWSDRWRWGACAAGALTGLGFAVGFEGAHHLALCGAVFAIRFIVEPDAARDLRIYGSTVAASTMAALLLTVAPGRWAVSACDALAFNSAGAVVIGGLGLWLIAGGIGARPLWRGVLVAAVAVGALAILTVAEPRCLGGPYALVDAQVRPLWLAHVREMQPLLSVFARSPLTGLGIATFPAAAVLATFVLAPRAEFRRDLGFLVAGSSLLLAVVTMFAAIKGYSYAMWLGMPLVAAFALQLCAALKLTALVPRFVAGLLLTPMALSAGAITIANAAGIDEDENFTRPERQICFRTASYAPLAGLPPGLMVTDIDYGPFLLALTPHQATAAPYHRLSAGIVDAHRVFAVAPEPAKQIVHRLGARYLATCGPRSPTGVTGAALAASLWGQLQAGRVPGWLERVPLDGAFAVYRVKRR
jgi:hypothetical protein